ncbi:glycoside hydrolase family 95 protein [Alkalicoccobacillus murimartini]|uniref:Alpha-L-fucosidase 2 n=1 Tax=Alkalicoccobacillus murimartini TaxID=171685 RepID=A0ABT9YHA1_9BACI|nr:glycoside hydrolase family 95 protein [Alkalicoccobacillus murimartini]MDQ0207247.1 alpha-L-fucosidase 2 [Alkalicoccobacillus murimartini]
MKLYYDQPSLLWTHALPIGNGSLGAMVYGGIQEERLQCNEDTIWSGAPRDQFNVKAIDSLPEVRSLLKEGKYKDANEAGRKLMGAYTQSYLPFCDIHLTFDHDATCSQYQRELDLEHALLTTSYTMNGVTYKRETFSSYVDRVIVMRLTASEPKALSFSARISSQLYAQSQTNDQRIHLTGRCPDHVDPSYYDTPDPVIYKEEAESEAIRFEAILDVKLVDGSVKSSAESLTICGATEVTLTFGAATSFNGYNRSPGKQGKDYHRDVHNTLQQAGSKSYSELLTAHVNDYQQLFQRVEFELDPNESHSHLPTDERIKDYGASDQGLVELLFHYGRYLLIASSRQGSQPANLQGIWNNELRPPWSSNYTLNINTEMNYWPAELCQLKECHTPLLQFISELAETGKQTASIHYDCSGWTAHHNSDIWRHSLPAGNNSHGEPIWTIWPMAGAWLTQHLWEHYLFNLDQEYLRKHAYPVMKGAAEFCLDWLIKNEDGFLITSPSTSPEHCFLSNGEPCGLSEASTMDIALIRELFTNTVDAAGVLQIDQTFIQKIKASLNQLLPYQIGERNRLQEWSKDYTDHEPEHRHVSHLFGVYPGHLLTESSSADLFHAAEQALKIRGNGGTGWSLAWKICLWARFRNGDQAHLFIHNLLQITEEDSINQKGGVYQNLFDAHPPFQIDGNFGYTAGVIEMLLQSHEDYISFLPALPKHWKKGRLNGVKARGGFIIDMEWRNRKLTKVKIHSEKGQTCRIDSIPTMKIESNGVSIKWEKDSVHQIISIDTIAGSSYHLIISG